MASGPIVDGGGGGGGDGSREKKRWQESKVYTRKAFKGPKATAPPTPTDTATTAALATATATATAATTAPNNSDNNSTPQQPVQAVASEHANSSQQPREINAETAVSDDSSSLSRAHLAEPSSIEAPPAGNGAVKPGISRLENRIKINLATRSKQETRELRRKLQTELDLVRSLVKKIEAKDVLGSEGGVVDDSVAKRVSSEVASAKSLSQSRPLHQLSISVIENSQGGSDVVEKEKRTPKANQFYRNSEFLLGKEKFPTESNKKTKLNGKKHGGVEPGYGSAMNKCFKNCGALLERLMKHKHGWVFNSPVDVKGLGLHDYFSIITDPMDLGTVKSRLNKNWYKSPREFAEDVRLTFHNAMTYNPKGQDVHVMAEVLSKIFEDKWAVIEAEKLPAPPPMLPSHEMRRVLDRSESMTYAVDPKIKPMNYTPLVRTPSLKKPKAKDPNKRDMTFEEKQKLSTNLQNLPSEKLDNIVHIIKRNNSALCQDNDEIEVDIDSVDAETLWELDRYVTNYKKSLSKNKRKAELAQARAEAARKIQERNPVPVVTEAARETNIDERNISSSSPVQGEKQGENVSGSSSSSSSDSDSGSSSSDSDSETSSADGSDARPSPRT
ncbi:unnamed protein product, partial [Vitis vinifera]